MGYERYIIMTQRACFGSATGGAADSAARHIYIAVIPVIAGSCYHLADTDEVKRWDCDGTAVGLPWDCHGTAAGLCRRSNIW